MHFYAHCYIYTYYTFVFLFFCLSLFSFVFNYQFSFTLLSLATFYELAETDLPYSSCPSSLLFSSVQLTPHISDILSSPKSSNRTNVKSGVSALSSTSTAFGTAASNARLDQTGNGHIDEALRQQALAEEEAAMNQYKVLGKLLAIKLFDSR